MNTPFIRKIRRKLTKYTVFRKILALLSSNRYTIDYHIINFSKIFDADYYLTTYPDIAEAKINPLQHYIEYGAKEYRNPNKWFDSKVFHANFKNEIGNINPLLFYLLSNYDEDVCNKPNYHSWIKNNDIITLEDRNTIKKAITNFKIHPKFSIILPVYNSEILYLDKAIESVKNQLYVNWEICIADDKSTREEVTTYLRNQESDQIKVFYREQNGHISEASNSALSLASGEFVVLLDHDDEFSENALFEVAKAVNRFPDAKLIYSDEDKIDVNGNRYDPYFKSDWNRDLFYSHNFISHLGVYNKEIIDRIDGFRKGYEGSQDYDLALRFIEQIDEKNIIHIPKILYHWRAVAGSTSLGIGEKNYALEAGRNALNSHFSRKNKKAKAEAVYGSQYRIRWSLPNELPKVSIIIPFKDEVQLLKNCLTGILQRTSYDNLEIILVNNESIENCTIQFLDSLDEERIRILNYTKPFNYSAINNYAVGEAAGEIICLLNNDIDIINNDWLNEMVSHALRSEVGAVGAKLYYPDDTVQHAGVILGLFGVAGHIHKHIARNDLGYMGRASLTQNLSAVTAACMVLRKSLFEQVNGFNENDLKIAFNDIDLCLRIRTLGYNIVYTPFSELYHFESKSRGNDTDPDKIDRFKKEINYMKTTWDSLLEKDPYFNPNLDLYSYNYNLSFKTK